MRRVLRPLLVLGVLLAVGCVVLDLAIVGRMGRIDGAFDGLHERPGAAPGRTFLVLGTRPGTDGGADVPWLGGRQSVEAVLLVDVAPDGRSALVGTVPASSTAADAATGEHASDLVGTVETWSGQRVDHLIAIDWTTFEHLAAVNGVERTYAWGSGPAAQRDYLRTVMDQTLHQELRKRPWDLVRTLATTAGGTSVDDGWSVLDMDLLVVSLRDLRSGAISYGTARGR